MKESRKQIDGIDDQILNLLAERMTLARAIARKKKTAGLKLRDFDREEEVMERISKLAKEKNLSTGFVQKLYKRILIESRKNQKGYRAN